MKRFQFNLQKVLDLRQFQEDQAKNDLAASIAVSERIRLDLEQIAREMVAAGNVRITSDIPAMQANEAYKVRLKLRKGELLEELARNELVVEEKRKIFAEKMKDRKIISKLREKAETEYRKQMHKEEEAAVDDITGAKFAASRPADS